jgi:hypothetical protein
MIALFVLETPDGILAFSRDVENDSPETLKSVLHNEFPDMLGLYVYDVFIVEGTLRSLGADYF